MNVFKKIHILAEEYKKLHGSDDMVATLEFSYGTHRAVEILENSNGREIESKYVKGCVDHMLWRYKGEELWREE